MSEYDWETIARRQSREEAERIHQRHLDELSEASAGGEGIFAFIFALAYYLFMGAFYVLKWTAIILFGLLQWPFDAYREKKELSPRTSRGLFARNRKKAASPEIVVPWPSMGKKKEESDKPKK